MQAYDADAIDGAPSRVDEELARTRGRAGFAYALAVMTGVVDAVVFIRCGVLPSVMTANTVFLGVNAFQGTWEVFALSLLAIVAFTLGSIAAGRIARGCDVPTRCRRLAWIEGLLLAGIGAIGVVELVTHTQWELGLDRYLVVALAAVAMAVQTPQVRMVEAAPVSTTFLTGALSVLGYGLAEPHPDSGLARKERLIVAVLAGYAVGGLIGGFATTYLPGWGLVIPVVLFVAGWWWFTARGTAR